MKVKYLKPSSQGLGIEQKKMKEINKMISTEMKIKKCFNEDKLMYVKSDEDIVSLTKEDFRIAIEYALSSYEDEGELSIITLRGSSLVNWLQGLRRQAKLGYVDLGTNFKINKELV